MGSIFTDFNAFTSVEPITKGWSGDKKYCVTTHDGTKYLLRISPTSRFEARKLMFEMLQSVAALDIPMCVPVELGTCDEGVYTLHSWIDGEDLRDALPWLTETEQYVLGLKAGELLRKIHTLPAPETQEPWAARYNRKADMKIEKYHTCGLKFDGDTHILDYLEQNRHLLENRQQCYQHGDYHDGNMMLAKGELQIIDFDRYDFGDPWEEFNRIVWPAATSSHFATGQIRGYFGGKPPELFWRLLAFYIASNTLSSVYWAIPFGQVEIDTMMQQAQDVLAWFDNMQSPVPTWYLKDFYIQWVDGIPYRLEAPYDFSFLAKYGTVFKVFDEQGSGNISFGVRNGEKKYFIKFAGAPRKNYIANRDSGAIDAESAIRLLQNAVPV